MIKGYKVFNPDWTCIDKQYTCPGKFEEDIKLELCETGMHFCKKAVDCFNYYSFDSSNHVAEVIAYGDVLEKGDKCCTDKLEIVREIPWAELLEMVNTGGGNTGNKNSGDGNSGDENSGYGNSGHRNSGDENSGHKNSGNSNSGNHNSGHKNSGDGNSGNGNSGDFNSGDKNSGSYNSGDWNECDYSSGCFNTNEQKIYFFNQPSEWTYRDWYYSKARKILCKMPEEAVNEWWKKLDTEDKEEIKALPNFDSEIFKEITGIDVDDIS